MGPRREAATSADYRSEPAAEGLRCGGAARRREGRRARIKIPRESLRKGWKKGESAPGEATTARAVVVRQLRCLWKGCMLKEEKGRSTEGEESLEQWKGRKKAIGCRAWRTRKAKKGEARR